MYLTDNWRAFRAWGVSAISAWEYEHYWKPREGVNRSRTELNVDWENLQRPGFSPDYIEQRYERMDLAFERADWIATPAAQALIRNNRPLLAFIGGKTEAFTSKDHIFHPGQLVEKQLEESAREDSPAPDHRGSSVCIAHGDDRVLGSIRQKDETQPRRRFEEGLEVWLG
jgi:hypothetical protein